MNNSRNFTNTANSQNTSSTLKDKLKKFTTGIALAGTLMMGTACHKQKNTVADPQKEKIETVEVKSNKDTLTEERYLNEVKKINLDIAMQEADQELAKQETERNEINAERDEINAERNEINAEIQASFKRQAKDWDGVSLDLLHSSEQLQQNFLDYIADCKEYGFEPNAHAKELLASLKK